MDILKYLNNFINDPVRRMWYLSYLGVYKKWPDEKYIKKLFKLYMGYDLNLKNPQTFNEKMQWLKLYNRDDRFTNMVDKYEAKSIATQLIGQDHVIKSYGVWDKFDDIDFDILPNQFVLKTTHDCGGVVICKNKSSFDKINAKRILEHHLKHNYYLFCREWPYKNVKPRILAEEFKVDGEYTTLPVYKIFTFSGNPFLIQVIQNDKTKDESIDYFNTKWEKQNLRQNYPNSMLAIPKPNCLEEMLELSRKLSMDLPFVRTDLYVINGEVYFSEFTFFSDAGFERFYPNEWDSKLGDLICIPTNDVK